MRAMASQITGVLIVCPTVCSGADQRIHQSSASLAFVRGSYQSPVNYPHKGPVTLKMLTFDDVIMNVVHANDSERGRVMMAMAYGLSSTWPVTVIMHGFNTHWSRNKMAASFLMTFSNAFSWMKIWKLTRYSSFGSDNCLAPTRRRISIKTNYG